jgi:hypothetical protein
VLYFCCRCCCCGAFVASHDCTAACWLTVPAAFELSNLPRTRCPRAPTDAFRIPAAEAGTFQPSLLGARTPTDAFRTLAVEAGTTMSGNRPVNSAKNVGFHVHLGIFYMPPICDMGPTALLPFRRKACLRIFPL